MYDQEAEINALRDTIISGEVKEFDGVITGDHVQFITYMYGLLRTLLLLRNNVILDTYTYIVLR